jgi:uncharacterized protein YwqG
LADEAKNAIVFASAAMSDADLPIGCAKLGGEPDMHHSIAWPRRLPYSRSEWLVEYHIKEAAQLRSRKRAWAPFLTIEEQLEAADRHDRLAARLILEEPLSFIGQFRLEPDMAARSSLEDLPKAGRFLLFYDAEAQPWGMYPDHSTGFRLIYDDSPDDSVERRKTPDAAIRTFNSAILTPHDVITALPPDTHRATLAVTTPEEYNHLRDWWFDVYLKESPNLQCHQLGGWPDVIQGDMQEKVQYVSHGIALTGSDAYDEGRRRGLAAGADDWVLLLQICSDEAAGMMWGDDGYLYVWIRKQDLKDRRFDKSRHVLQCY